MGFFRNLFKKDDKAQDKIVRDVVSLMSPEAKALQDLHVFMNNTLSADAYIAKSDYRQVLLEGKPTIDYFAVLMHSGVLTEYCRNNGIEESIVLKALEQYQNFETLVDTANEKYIQNNMKVNKSYLDHILSEVDPKIILDDDQRRVVLTDEDYCLVIAGAGAGKTTTVAAKVKYLVEKKRNRS